MTRLPLVFLLCVSALVVRVECWIMAYPMDNPATCETISVPLCLGNHMKYNRTRLPNHIGYTDQADIRLFTKRIEFERLIKTKCSADLVFFLCATLVPICVNSGHFATPPMVRPCRILCETVYNDCISSMRKFNFHWPANLNCSSLPDHATGMCVRPSSFAAPQPPSFGKPKVTCRARLSRKNLKVKNLSKHDHIFRAKRVSSNGDNTKLRLSVQKFFKPNYKNNPRTQITVRNCRNHARLFSKKMFLVLGNKENDVLKISEIIDWKVRYPRDIRTYFKRQGNKG